MDPPTSTEDGGRRPGGGGDGNGHPRGSAEAEVARRSADPPEEFVPRPPRRCAGNGAKDGRGAPRAKRPPPPRRGRRGVLNGTDDDDRVVDAFEMEGLIPPLGSRAGAGGGGGSPAGRRALGERCAGRCALVLSFRSVAWSRRNPARSAIAVLFLALLYLTILRRGEDEGGGGGQGGGGGLLGGFGTFRVRPRSRADPLSSLSPDQRTSLLKELYGSWTFYDGSADDRPKEPYVTAKNAGNDYLDLPAEKFPEDSWQSDAVYANHFLDAAEKLVTRGMKAIYATYNGYGISDVKVNEDGSFEYAKEDEDERVSKRKGMFHLEDIDLGGVKSEEELDAAAPDWRRKGGWTTSRSWDGLARRITHAIVTEGTFTVVFTGSWQSLGYGGNHGFQSSAAQFDRLLKGPFARMGVTLQVRAVGLPPQEGLDTLERAEVWKGGKSTLVHALGWSSIYGSDVDMVVWDDYGVPGDADHETLDDRSAVMFDLFARQALLSGRTSLPFLWGGDFDVLRNLHELADADVGQLGTGMAGVPQTTSIKGAYDLPLAARFLNCAANVKDSCAEEAFASECWVEGDEAPPTPQWDRIPAMPFAPGWRVQQLKGYAIAYTFLAATLEAINRFSEVTIAEGFPLPDEHWHMKAYVENVREKVTTLDEIAAPHCFRLEEELGLPKRLCRNKLKGRTEFTPRADPGKTSVRTLLDATKATKVAETRPELWQEKKETDHPMQKIPTGEVDAVQIFDLQGKRRVRRRLPRVWNNTIVGGGSLNGRDRRAIALTAGDGWQLLHGYGDGCNGSPSSSDACGRPSSGHCLLEGHQGSRGGVWGNETTGWLLLRVPSVENGFVALNLEVGGRESAENATIPDALTIEYAVEGVITTLGAEKLRKEVRQPVPGMNLLVVFDNEESKDAIDMLVTVRAIGCPDCQFAVTHVYWS
ncbi:hypothetical protein ACHAWF_005510 [Thalassiosira exigua]